MEVSCRLIATDNFYPQEKHDLGFAKGEILQFLGLVDENWGRGELNGKRGIFPLGFTKQLDEVSKNCSDLKFQPNFTCK